MGNQNKNGVKYCCKHKPLIKYSMDERGYQVICLRCGKTVEGYASSTEAIRNWNNSFKK